MVNQRTTALLILGLIAVIAIIGLVMIFSEKESTGAIFASHPGGPALCNIQTLPGEAQWFSESNPEQVKKRLLQGEQCAVIKDGKITQYINAVKDIGGVGRENFQFICCRWQ